MSRYAILEGADRLFAAEIAHALGAEGLSLEGPPDAAPVALILNRAAPLIPTAFERVTDDAFAAALEDGLLAVFDQVQSWVPRLADGAAIVMVSSRAWLGAWGTAPEAAAGAALAGFCRTLALELAPRRIRVNLAACDFPQAYADDPAGRARVGDAVAWLAGPRSGATNGQTLLLDEGRGLEMREARARSAGSV